MAFNPSATTIAQELERITHAKTAIVDNLSALDYLPDNWECTSDGNPNAPQVRVEEIAAAVTPVGQSYTDTERVSHPGQFIVHKNFNRTLSVGGSISIPKGWHDGTGSVVSSQTDDDYKLTTLSATPTKSTQNYNASDSGFYGYSTVAIDPIPTKYQDVSGVTAAAGNVLTGKSFVTSNGTLTAGTMANNGAVAATVGYGGSYTIPAGYHNGTGTVTDTTPAINASIGGTASAGSATAVITNSDSVATITDISGKTAGTDYWGVKATATTTAGGYTPKYTVTTAGYLGSTVTGSKQTVSVTADSTGKSIYIPKATFGTSGASTTVSSAGYIPKDAVVGTVSDVVGSIGGSASAGSATAAITNVNSINTTTNISGKTAGTDYWQIKATATGTKGTYTPKYTVTTAGYLGETVNGTAQDVNVTGDSTGKSIYIPKATFTTSSNIVKVSTAGYIPSGATAGTIPGINASIGGTIVTAGSATAAISNVNSMNTITDVSGKTAGTDYWAVKATATGNNASYKPVYTVATGGYLGSTVNGTATSVTVNSDTTGKTIYIPKATFSTSGADTTVATAGYIPANTKVSNMTNRGAVSGSIDGLNTTSYTIQAGYHNGSGTVTFDPTAIVTALAAI